MARCEKCPYESMVGVYAKQLARFRDDLAASKERERLARTCLKRLMAMLAGEDHDFAQMIADCRDAKRSRNGKV